MGTRNLWRAVGLASVLTTALLVFGLVYAAVDVLNPQPSAYMAAPDTQKTETPLDEDSIRIVALGDSLTKGTGDTSGRGYVGQVKEKLEARSGKPVTLIGNYGVNGYKTNQLLSDLQAPGVSYGIEKANVILFTMGGNDLFAISQNVMNAETDELDPDKVRARMPEPLKRMEQILARLVQLNPKAVIVYVGVYNPFYDLPVMRPASAHVADWNDAVFRAASAYPNVIYVPTMDLFQLNFAKYMYSDHFHPNEAGYERIAERVVQALQ